MANRKPRLAVVVLLMGLLGTGFVVGPLHAQEPAALLPLNDNTAPPHMGIYRGVPKGGIEQVDEYTQWLNRTLMWGHFSQGWDNWGSVDKAYWLLGPTSKWVAALPGRRIVFSIPLMPWPPKDGDPYTLKEGAAGAYNSHFETLAKMLVDDKLDNSILRLGWEFDGGWYPWKTQTPENAAYMAQFFHQVVTAMHAVPGAEKLEFCWNGAGENVKYQLAEAWPGDDAVNYVGLDIYDKTWAKDVYPVPPDATPEQKLEREQKAWKEIYGNKHGIKTWIEFAKAHHKPFFIPEWGLWSDKNHGGADDPYFIQQMYNLIHDPANNVYEAAYWDSREAKVIPTGGNPSQYPASAALFQKLFSLPGGPAPATQPALAPSATPPAATPPAAPVTATTLPVTTSGNALELALGNTLTIKLALIPAGKFIMGSPDNEQFRAANEGPQHEVTISKPFYMSIYTVTQEQYEAVMGKNPSRYKGPSLPVQPMSWEDISGFCAKLSEKTGRKVRIPTEAEWEYACRAGTQTAWFWGDDPKTGDDYGWFGLKEPKPVGGKKPNPWGLYDMAGNVAQVCSDLGAMYPKPTMPYAAGPVTDPTGPTEGTTQHVCRGQGGWIGHSRSAGHRGAFANIQAGDHLYSIRLVVEARNN